MRGLCRRRNGEPGWLVLGRGYLKLLDLAQGFLIAYKKLLSDLRRIIREGKEEAERAAAQALIESYWAIGKRIAKEKLSTRAAYHNAILGDLSADLGIDLRTLQRTVSCIKPTNALRVSKAWPGATTAS